MNLAHCEKIIWTQHMIRDNSFSFFAVIDFHWGGVACCIRNDLSYNIPEDTENIFYEILLPNSKPIVVVKVEAVVEVVVVVLVVVVVE